MSGLLSFFNSSQSLVYQTLRAFLSLLSFSMFPYLGTLFHIYAGRAEKENRSVRYQSSWEKLN
jgi:hypothetical protein